LCCTNSPAETLLCPNLFTGRSVVRYPEISRIWLFREIRVNRFFWRSASCGKRVIPRERRDYKRDRKIRTGQVDQNWSSKTALYCSSICFRLVISPTRPLKSAGLPVSAWGCAIIRTSCRFPVLSTSLNSSGPVLSERAFYLPGFVPFVLRRSSPMRSTTAKSRRGFPCFLQSHQRNMIGVFPEFTTDGIHCSDNPDRCYRAHYSQSVPEAPSLRTVPVAGFLLQWAAHRVLLKRRRVKGLNTVFG